MSHLLKTFLLLPLLTLAGTISAQSSCGSEEPFLLPPTSTFCADSSGMVTVNFKVYNNGDPGTYRIEFPDGSDTVYTNVVNTATVTKRFLFDCGQPPGKPTPPSNDALFYEYQGALTIIREDCVDERGDKQKGSYDFRVVPNPILDIKTSDLTCIEAPFIINFEGKLCSEKLVESYQWYMDGELLEGETSKKLKGYEFESPGTYVARLEVTPFKGCDKYYYDKPFTIRPTPKINLSYELDTAQLCNPTIQVITNSTYEYATKYSWSSPSAGVTFSDPSAPNPVIDIDNNKAGVRVIIVNASNQYCSAVADTFEVTTYRGQTIEVIEDIVTCTGYVLDLCESLKFQPTPDNIRWSADKPDVNFSDSTAVCPKLTFADPGEYVITATGFDVCGDQYNIPINIRVRDGAGLVFDISSIDTICTTEPPIQLLDFVSRPDNVSRISGPGVADNVFSPSLVEGDVQLVVVDSCGASYPLDFFVIPQEVYLGEDLVICQGDSVNLYDLQAGSYTGTGVENNVFESAGLDVGIYRIAFSSLTYCGGEDTLSITVQEFPRAAFRVVTDSCGDGTGGAIFAGLDPINVENLSSAKVICYEILETGQQACNREKARFLIQEPGTYTLQQVVAFPGGQCTDTTTISINVLFPPVLNFYADMDSSICDSLTIGFSVGDQPDGLTYDWSFTSSDRSTEANPVIELIRPLAPEVLGVKTAVSNACYTTTDTFGVVLPLRFRVSFDILNDNNTVCSDDTIFLSNTSVNAFDYRVSYPDGRQATELPRTLVLRNTTDRVLRYPITLEGSNVSCPDELHSDTIYILPITTEAAFGLNYKDICSEAEVTLDNSSTPGALTFVHWGDGSSPQFIDELESITHTYNVERDTTYQIELVAQLCGIDTFSHSITVRPSPDPSFEVLATEANCVDKEIQFTPTGNATTYGLEWDFGDGKVSQKRNAAHVFEQPGNYNVKLEVVSRNGCKSVDSTEVQIGEYNGAAMSFEMPRSACEEMPFAMNIVSPQTGWTFDYGNGLVSLDDPLDAPYFNKGTYEMNLRVTSANGCSIDSSTVIKVFPGFEATIKTAANQDTIVELGDKLDLRVNVFPPRNIAEMQWTGDSIANPNSPYTTALPLQDGFYAVELQDVNGCIASDSMRVRVNKDYRDRIFAPNAFSPNNDGYNDFFGLDVKDNTVRALKTLRVMSRYGAIVYECKDCTTGSVGNGWDGRLGDKLLESNVYIWAAEVDFVDGTSQLFTGDVTLLR
ncbi:gliding motility-associated-like protein [Lewinella aquimaris]|uniref:Gliding motility-associated-like protein n=1 Tax=Neolewinella aquimaris TaxID=1835722 RepID=A0A840E1C8_9BACT|nr:PKD domain-containing protein [Neolewinella aquimaris]MBB4077572.1 gliding motility-associated-like protein [Neolewinella aquimaris]